MHSAFTFERCYQCGHLIIRTSALLLRFGIYGPKGKVVPCEEPSYQIPSENGEFNAKCQPGHVTYRRNTVEPCLVHGQQTMSFWCTVWVLCAITKSDGRIILRVKTIGSSVVMIMEKMCIMIVLIIIKIMMLCTSLLFNKTQTWTAEQNDNVTQPRIQKLFLKKER